MGLTTSFFPHASNDIDLTTFWPQPKIDENEYISYYWISSYWHYGSQPAAISRHAFNIVQTAADRRA
jgi:hypothetical protein